MIIPVEVKGSSVRRNIAAAQPTISQTVCGQNHLGKDLAQRQTIPRDGEMVLTHPP